MKEQIKKTAIIILATTSMAASTQAANIVINGDFQLPDITGLAADTSAIPNWNKDQRLVRMDQFAAGNQTNLIPGNTVANQVGDTALTPGLNQAMRMGGNLQATTSQDFSHNWAATDTMTVSFNASEVFWRAGGTGDDLTANIVETVSGAVLWTSGLIDMDGTHAGDVAAADLQDWSAIQTFSYILDPSAFIGTEGSAISVQFVSHGIASLDNVVVDVTAVPEPSAAALLGLGGLALILRRRK